MLSNNFLSESRFQYVINNFFENEKYQLSYRKKKLLLLESVLFKTQNMDKNRHYDYIDPNSNNYSARYENHVSSDHVKNIYFQSLLLAKTNYEKKNDPLRSLYLFERLMPLHAYKAIFMNDDSSVIVKILTQVSNDLHTAFDYLSTKQPLDVYEELISTEGKDISLPPKLYMFLKDLKRTSAYIDKVKNYLKD